MSGKWEQWQIDLFKEQYGKMPSAELAEKLGKKKQCLYQYARRHGITTGRYWTKEQEDLLYEKAGVLSSRRISELIGRDYKSVLSKRKKSGIGSFLDNTEHLHLAAVCELVGRDKETIKKTWFAKGLKYRKRGRYTMIMEENLIKWMEENPKYWDATRCDYYFFQRFDWFQKKLLDDRARNHNERWGIAK